MSKENQLSNEADKLSKLCVYLNDIPNNCSECDERPATVYIEIDLGFMTTSIGDGQYCEECGNELVERIRELLPDEPQTSEPEAGKDKQ